MLRTLDQVTFAGQSSKLPGAVLARPSTRSTILEVARREVSAHGYERVSIRSIARQAGVDPRLVRHYFQSKERLLRHAVHVEVDPRQVARQILDGPVRSVGQRTAESLLDQWDDPRGGPPAQARLSASMTSDEVAASLRDEFLTPFFGALTAGVSPDRPELRAALAAAHTLGFAICRDLVRVPALDTLDRADSERMLGRLLHQALVEPLPTTGD